jgi:hypothetical protein
MLLLQMTTLATAQEGHIAFLKQFKKFVTKIEVAKSLSSEQLTAADSVYSCYDQLYSTRYKANMNNDEKKQFSEYKARYRKSRLSYKVDKLTNKIDSAGSQVGDKIQGKGSEIIGTIKGWLKENEKE